MNRPLVSPYTQIDTPALLIDNDIMTRNIAAMQEKADRMGVNLRPHTKTHKMPAVARRQMAAGACGIAVAKPGEAEEMARAGIADIFIANEIISPAKLSRLRALGEQIALSFGVDSLEGLKNIEAAFAGSKAPARVLIEVETGEKRSGVTEDRGFIALIEAIKWAENIELIGVFSHEGFTYKAKDQADCLRAFEECQRTTLHFAQLARSLGLPCPTVSVGATPTALLCDQVLEGITELRPGTYVFMDAGQAGVIQSFDNCAATVLSTIVSKPTDERLIGDVGAKGLTMQTRTEGICRTKGLGYIVGSDGVWGTAVYDEHYIVYDKTLNQALNIGDQIEIIPNHICPVVNLYDQAYLVSNGEIVEILPISCRGKMQ